MIKNKPYPYYKVEYVDNFKDFLNFCDKKYNNNIAFEYKKNNINEQKSFNQFSLDVKALATYFISNNIVNNKIAIIGENSYEWILSYFAIANSGNIVIPIDKELSIDQIKFILEETKTSTVVISNTYEDYEKIIKEELKLNIINIKNGFREVLEEGLDKYNKNSKIYEDYKINSEDVVAIVYTSGTTGNPKGAMLTHANIIKNVISGMESFEMHGSSILILPLHHTYAFSGAMLCVMYSGCKNYINKSLKNMIKDLEQQKPTFILSVPLIVETFYKKIWKNAKENKKDKLLKIMIRISSFLLFFGIDLRRKLFKSVLKAFGGNLEFIICGGAAIDKKYIKGFKNFGIDILVGYGITECSPFIAVNRNRYYRYGSAGAPLTCSTVKIDIYENKTEGEILVKGPMVMKGYYNNSKLTNEVMDGEYFRTGDIGYQDKDGFIFITGRKKNVIILSNGKNVYPEELEFELMKNEAIQEVIVQEGDSNNIKVEIYPNSDYIIENNIKDKEQYFRKYIDSFNKTQPLYKNINSIKLRDFEFPKTTSKKIKRNYLSENNK